MRGGRSIVRSPGEKRRAWSKNVKRDSPPAFLLLCVCNPSSLTPSCRDTPSLVHRVYISLHSFLFFQRRASLFSSLPFSLSSFQHRGQRLERVDRKSRLIFNFSSLLFSLLRLLGRLKFGGGSFLLFLKKRLF